MRNWMECLIMTYGRDFKPMAEIFFWFLHDFGISGYVHLLAQCVLALQIHPALFRKPAVFLGATVTHPPAGKIRNQVLLLLYHLSMLIPPAYSPVVRIQRARKQTGFRPHRMFEQLAIRQACWELEADYRPGITFIVEKKRHHTRRFRSDQRDQSGRAGKVHAGTTVYANITHPTENHFYLCSHQGIQERPSHHKCFWDNDNLSANEMQNLTSCYKCIKEISEWTF